MAEIKEQGELVIESNGKEVKKNASPDNPVYLDCQLSNVRR